MKIYTTRLKTNTDLKISLQDFAIKENIQSGFILTAIGSLKQANIRFANQDRSTIFTEKFEIISLNGTIATSGLHLHMAIADREGKIMGGHLVDGCIIYTTAEIVIGCVKECTFLRTFDEQTGYKELEIICNS